MKTYKAMGRLGGTHAGSCLFAWSWLLFYLKEECDSSKKSRGYGEKKPEQFFTNAQMVYLRSELFIDAQ